MHKNHRVPPDTIQEEDEERAAAEFLALVRESSQGFAAVMIDKAVLPMCHCDIMGLAKKVVSQTLVVKVDQHCTKMALW